MAVELGHRGFSLGFAWGGCLPWEGLRISLFSRKALVVSRATPATLWGLMPHDSSWAYLRGTRRSSKGLLSGVMSQCRGSPRGSPREGAWSCPGHFPILLEATEHIPVPRLSEHPVFSAPLAGVGRTEGGRARGQGVGGQGQGGRGRGQGQGAGPGWVGWRVWGGAQGQEGRVWLWE